MTSFIEGSFACSLTRYLIIQRVGAELHIHELSRSIHSRQSRYGGKRPHTPAKFRAMV